MGSHVPSVLFPGRTLLAAAESLVVAADALGELGRDGVAVDWDQRVRRLAFAYFLGNSPTQLSDRLGDEVLEFGPVGFLGVAFEFLTCASDPVADSRRFGS